MRIISHAYPQQQQQQQQHQHQQQQQQHQQYLHHHHHHHHHHQPLPPLPAIDNDTTPDTAGRIDHHHHAMSHSNADRRAGVFPHDHAPRSSYSNSPATLSHHERPSVDPTTLRALVNDWQPPHLRNGEKDHKDFQPSSSSNKRKLEESPDELQSKIRRIVRDHLTMDYSRPMSMTTVLCLHAAVAQKSYGSEKRFLCPPPVVRIDTPFPELKNQHLAMSIVTESGERGTEQRSPLDNNMVANFKYLHVSNTAKSKSFQLALDIAESPVPHAHHHQLSHHPHLPHLSPTDPTSATDAPPPPPSSSSSSAAAAAVAAAVSSSSPSIPGRIWASFDSAPVTIISKPSKKTAKTRNISSCILAGGPVSLFNRINSQTVRTKYMTIEHTQLCASNLSWSAFNVNVLRRPHDNMIISNQALQSSPSSHHHHHHHHHQHHQHHPNSPMGLPSPPLPVIYGCEIQLLDTLTGIATSPLIIRKVDKGKVSPEDGGPVSQMQKIALQRVNPDGTRSYLSAASPVAAGGSAGASGGGGASTSSAGAGASASAGSPGPPPPTPGSAGQPASHPLIFQSPHVREEVRDGVRIITDEVDDFLCWTIVGISKFQYTFFDGSGQNTPIPRLPITPFPTLFTAPGYRPAPHTIELTVSNFFYTNPETMQHTPLEVWLGPIGPLRQRIFQATGPPGPLTNIAGLNGLPPPPPPPPVGHGHGVVGGMGMGVVPLPINAAALGVGVGMNPSGMVPALNGIGGVDVGMLQMGMGMYGHGHGHSHGPAQQSSANGNASTESNNNNNNNNNGQVVSPTSSSQPPTPGSGSNNPPPPPPLASSSSSVGNVHSPTASASASAATPVSIAPQPQPQPPASSSSSSHQHQHQHQPPHPPPQPPHSPPVAPPRFMPQGPLHTIVLVDLPPIAQIVRTARESVGLPSHLGYLGESVPSVPGLEMGVNVNLGGGIGLGVGLGVGGDDEKRSSPSPLSALPSALSSSPSTSSPHHPQPPPPPPPLPTLPILFMRTYDGIGYHSGRSIACEPNLSGEQVERIRRGAFGGGVGGAAGSSLGVKTDVKEEGVNVGANASSNGSTGAGAGAKTGTGGGGHGLLDEDVDWAVRVL